jgi:hypothetical protein
MKFKQTFQFALICLLSSAIFLTTSCKKDEPPARDKFLGAYNVNENCTTGNFNYSITITASTNSEDAVIISNYGDYAVNVRATVSGSNININDTQGGITFSGSGNISGNTLTIIYTASAVGLTDDCTATCIRQ